MDYHLLQSIDARTGGGLVGSCLELASAQREIGVNSQVISTTCGELRHSTDHLIIAPRKFHTPILYAEGLFKHLKSIDRTDMIHNHGLYMYTSWLATKLKKTRDIRMMVHVHGMMEPWILRRSKLKKAIVNLLFENYKYKNAEYWRALTHKEADQIRGFGVNGKIIIAPNGIDLEPIDSFLENLKKVPVEKKTILFLGRLHEKKGLVPFLKTWLSLPLSIRRQWQLKIAGPDDGALSELFNLKGTNDGVEFLGPVTGQRKFEVLEQCDLFVLPSFSEGFSMALLEACAFSKPIILTDQCNFSEAFEFGGMRLSEVDFWKNELIEILSTKPEELGQRGASLRSLVEQKYLWNTIAQDLQDQL
ncbi:glycosyltransferase [Marinoscillum sp.]|uniref:glycosyltransferase n=1 Tax=Marinoscillum sp. TaxID=2024838 RepID=UPI003BA86DC2